MRDITLLLLAAGCWIVAALLPLVPPRKEGRFSTVVGATGSLLAIFAAAHALLGGTPTHVDFSFWQGPVRLELDALSAAFLLPLHLVAGLGIVYGLEYWPVHLAKGSGRSLRFFFGLLVTAMSLLFVTRNGLLFLVAWGLVDLAHMRHIIATDRSEAAVLFVTLAATLLLSLEIAILAGVVFSLLLYLNRSSHPELRSLIPDPRVPQRNMLEVAPPFRECPQMKILRIEGSLYFGAIEHVEDTFDAIRKFQPGQKHLLLMSKSINTVDLAGADLLQREARKRRAEGGDLYFYSLRKPVIKMFEATGYLNEFGRDHMFRGKREAFNTVFQRLDRSICDTCTARIFEECASVEGPKAA